MRKRPQWVVAVVLVLLALPAVVQSQNYTWETNNGAITITGYRGPGGDVTIPDKLPDTNGLPVTTIGVAAFSYRTTVTSVTIPNSVTNIDGWQFEGCYGLTKVAIGDGVLTIGGQAFRYCSSLREISVNSLNPVYSSLDGVLFGTNLTALIQYPAAKAGSAYAIPDGVTTIREEAFRHCSSLANITIPDSVTSIPNNAFQSCFALTNVAIGNGVISIGDSAFYECNKLVSVTIPDSVTLIGSNAFASCTSLSNVRIGNSVTNIGRYAFADCTSLKEITVEPMNSLYSSVEGVLFGTNLTTLIQYPVAKAGSAYTIPGTITTIGQDAFAGCNLASITIPDSVTTIGQYAFAGCNLDSMTIPDSVTSIPNHAFQSCFALTNVTIGNGVTSIGDYAFSCCFGLTSVTIGNSVTNIGGWAFYYIGNSLTELYFRTNAPSTGLDVFYGSFPATVYYLPGTTNWGTTFCYLPTALWQPQMQTRDTSFGVQTNQFGFNIAWSSGMKVAVDACTNLADPVWIPLQTNTLTADTFYYSDPDWANSPRRFYRVRWPGAIAP